jgi:hypothetical protein
MAVVMSINAEFYISPLAGFLVRYAYWAAIVLAVGAEVTAVGDLCKAVVWRGHVACPFIIVMVVADAEPCGSWLACDRVGAFTTVIAGKPAPTFDRRWIR